jgi:hypothetical protein
MYLATAALLSIRCPCAHSSFLFGTRMGQGGPLLYRSAPGPVCTSAYILREGLSPHGAPLVSPFCLSFSWETAQTKARIGADEEWGAVATVAAAPQSSSAPIRSLVWAVSQGKLRQNLLLKIPFKFKKSYIGTREPQTPCQDAPWLHGPSLKILVVVVPASKVRIELFPILILLDRYTSACHKHKFYVDKHSPQTFSKLIWMIMTEFSYSNISNYFGQRRQALVLVLVPATRYFSDQKKGA